MIKSWLKQPPLYPVYHLIWDAVDWLFPPTCAGCGTPGERWCYRCQEASKYNLIQYCPTCGNIQSSSDICKNCRDNPPDYTQLRFWGLFTGPLREAIHQLKYKNDITLGDIFAQNMIDVFNMMKWHVDFITPIPLHPNKLRNRGYNQSAMLALPMALKLRIPYSPRAISRIRDTHSQVGLNFNQRMENMQGAFQADQRLVEGKVGLVIDDVTTTGATMRECASALKMVGASAVFGLTLARTVCSDHDLQDQ